MKSTLIVGHEPSGKPPWSHDFKEINRLKTSHSEK